MEWSPERVAELTRLWNAGWSTAEIGRSLGISKNAVVGKAHRMRLSSRPSPIKRSLRPAGYRPTPSAATMPPLPRVGNASAAMTAAPPPPPKVVELSSQTCSWPIGHPGDSDFHFCVERAVAGKPYCASHAAMAYVKVKPKAGEAA